MGCKTHRLLELGVLFLGVNQVEGDVECPGQDKREEEGESSQVDVALCANADLELAFNLKNNERHALELSCCEIGIRSHVLDHIAPTLPRKVGLCAYSVHPLNGIEEEDCYESVVARVMSLESALPVKVDRRT